MKKAIIVYHANCLDGFGAYVVTRKALEAQDFEVLTIPMSYTDDWKDIGIIARSLRNCQIYCVDICPPFEDIHDMFKSAERLVILDHHKSAKETMLHNWPDSVHTVYDEQRSGVGITHDFFFTGQAMPEWIKYVQDRDLWQFKHDRSEAFCTGLFRVKQEYKEWLKLYNVEITLDVYREGLVLLDKLDKDCEDLMSIKHVITVGDRFILAVNAHWVYASKLGHMLANKSFAENCCVDGIACVYYSDGKGYKLSFRSVEGCAVNARSIAEQLGGGGHDHAAGASVSFNQLKAID